MLCNLYFWGSVAAGLVNRVKAKRNPRMSMRRSPFAAFGRGRVCLSLPIKAAHHLNQACRTVSCSSYEIFSHNEISDTRWRCRSRTPTPSRPASPGARSGPSSCSRSTPATSSSFSPRR